MTTPCVLQYTEVRNFKIVMVTHDAMTTPCLLQE